MDLVDVVGLAKNAKNLAKQTVNNSAAENRQFFTSTVEHAANKGVKVMGKTQAGQTILDGGKFLEKTANKGVKIVGKTQLGGVVLDGGKFVGGAAMVVGGTLTDTLTDGAGFVGGAVLGGADLLGKTAMMGTELLGEGINLLMGEDDASAFFHEKPEELEGYDNDFDQMLPERFQDPEKEKEVRPSMKVEWDEVSWTHMDGGPRGHSLAVVVDKTVSQRKLEIKEERENNGGKANKYESDEESSVESDKTEDIYFTDAEIRAKEKAEKRERKRLRKERKRMSKLARAEADTKAAAAKMKEDENFEALGKSYNFLSASERGEFNADGSLRVDGANEAEVTGGAPIQSLELPSNSGHMDGIQMKMRSKGLWGKLRQNVAQRAIVKTFQSNVKQNNDFFDAFDDLDAVDEMGDDPMGAATAMLNNEHDNEKDKVENLRKQLDEYEANLEKERKEVEEERKRIAAEKKELETQFKFESGRNEKLTKQTHDLKKELGEELEKKNEFKLQRELEELRAENEVLQEQVERHDSILRSLHREKAIREKREKRKQLYGGNNPHSSGATVQTFRSSGTGTVQFDDEATIVTYVAKSRRSSNIKVMEENLEEMNDELEARQKVVEMQVMELENLQKQLKEAEDRSGLKPLKNEFLELQKQKEEILQKSEEEKAELTQTLEDKKELAAKHAAELSRLKLDQTKKELKAAQEVEPPAEKGGLFSMLWGDTPKDEISDADVALSKLGL
ncbi:unnamed protein product [Cylindrotheca closterium]|uniref:Uncharacterized protein n=1 Tax=Cylindrotheca closterium TaxID=2856 RepID=A0AAD2G126_9STRA|nr:unnamed protein product [Cylindrotheca closterium]